MALLSQQAARAPCHAGCARLLVLTLAPPPSSSSFASARSIRAMFPARAEEYVLQIVSESSGRLALLLRAGASVSSGVPAAGAMIRECRAMAHRYAHTDEPLDAWCARQAWFGRDQLARLGLPLPRQPHGTGLVPGGAQAQVKFGHLPSRPDPRRDAAPGTGPLPDGTRRVRPGQRAGAARARGQSRFDRGGRHARSCTGPDRDAATR